VLSTIRNLAKAKALDDIGVNHVVIDDGSVAGAVRQLCPDGVDGALELIATTTLQDTLRCARVHGVACFTGMTAYGGDAADLPATILQAFIEDVEAGRTKVPIGHVFRLEEIGDAHQAMEDGAMTGKLVVTMDR
jgi:NADPH:quinone reductase-like Zn-dependent oxidoreductase